MRGWLSWHLAVHLENSTSLTGRASPAGTRCARPLACSALTHDSPFLSPPRSWQDRKGELLMRVESGDDTKLGESFDSESACALLLAVC